MVRILMLPFCLLAAACSSPSPRFIGAQVGVHETGGMRFQVFRRADEVEVLRSGGGIPARRDVYLGAIEAIRSTTGCAVRPRSMNGDQSIVTARIDCAG